MSRTQSKSSFETLAKTLSLQCEIAASFQTLADLDASAAKSLVSKMADIVGLRTGGENGGDGRQSTPSGYDKVVAAFLSNGNTALTKTALAAAANVTEGSLHTIVYGDRKDDFLKETNPEGGRSKVIRMAQRAFEEARATATRDGLWKTPA